MKATKQIIALLLLLTVTMLAQNAYVMDVSGEKRMFNVQDNASDDLDVTGAYTIEFWAYVDSTGSRPDKMVSRGPDGSTGNLWEINVADIGASGTKIQLHIKRGTSDYYFATDTLAFNTWYYISYTYTPDKNGDGVEDDPRGLLHVDGIRVGSRASTNFALPASDSLLMFFAQPGTGYLPYDGSFDGFRFSDSARYGWGDYTAPSLEDTLESDARTVLLFNFEDNTQLPPVNTSDKNFTIENGLDGSSFLLTTSNYVVNPVPVELTKFEASVKGDVVLLSWETATEVNNYGFSVQTKSAISDNWKEIGFINGAGNSNAPRQYSFVDTRNIAGEVSYRLKQIDINGDFEYSDVITVNTLGKATYKLAQNTPNPFNPSTKISFTIPEAGNVKLNVYNSLGQLVKVLVNKNLQAGTYQYQFNANGLSSGIYFYSITVNGFTDVKKMNLLK